MTNRWTIVLAVLVVAGAVFLARGVGTRPGGGEEELRFPGNPDLITIASGSNVVHLRSAETGWIVESLGKPANPDRVQTILSSLSGTVAYPVIATSSGPEQFGLDQGISIEISGLDGKRLIVLGSTAADGQSVYARSDDDRNVLLVPVELREAATGDNVAFRDPVVRRWPESEIQSLELRHLGERVVTMVRTAGSDTEEGGDARGATQKVADEGTVIGSSVLASAKRVERIGKQWRPEGPSSDSVQPYQMENMFQELESLTVVTYQDESATGGGPVAELVVTHANGDVETLRIHEPQGDLFPAGVGNDSFLMERRRVLRLTMGLVQF